MHVYRRVVLEVWFGLVILGMRDESYSSEMMSSRFGLGTSANAIDH